MGFLSIRQIEKLNFKYVGENVSISSKASFYGINKISIGNNTRIDDFVLISAGVGGINIGKNVHIAAFTSLIGKGKITVGDYSNFSSRVSVYSSSDDYSGKFMTNPTVNEKFTGVDDRDVFIGKHVIIGCGSVILPGSIIEEGVAIGSLSLVKSGYYKKFGIYAGTPVKYLKKRLENLINLETDFEKFLNE